MDFHDHRSRRTTSAAWPAPSPTRCARRTASASWTSSTSASTATCGRKLIDADILSAPRRRSRWAAAVSAFSSRRPCWSRSAADGGRALSRVGGARRGRAGEVRLRGAATGVGGAGGQRRRRSSPSRSTARWVRARSRQRRSGGGYRLTGTRTQVGYGPVADAFLVPAETDSGVKVFLVADDDAGRDASPR